MVHVACKRPASVCCVGQLCRKVGVTEHLVNEAGEEGGREIAARGLEDGSAGVPCGSA